MLCSEPVGRALATHLDRIGETFSVGDDSGGDVNGSGGGWGGGGYGGMVDGRPHARPVGLSDAWTSGLLLPLTRRRTVHAPTMDEGGYSIDKQAGGDCEGRRVTAGSGKVNKETEGGFGERATGRGIEAEHSEASAPPLPSALWPLLDRPLTARAPPPTLDEPLAGQSVGRTPSAAAAHIVDMAGTVITTINP